MDVGEDINIVQFSKLLLELFVFLSPCPSGNPWSATESLRENDMLKIDLGMLGSQASGTIIRVPGGHIARVGNEIVEFSARDLGSLGSGFLEIWVSLAMKKNALTHIAWIAWFDSYLHSIILCQVSLQDGDI